VRLLVAALFLVVALGPQPGLAAACEYKLGETVRVTGTYVPSGQGYARTFVFALQMDCGGTKELVTVQQSTGNLPVCKPQERVEVLGKLTWNKFLIDGHYEINSPSSVTCLPEVATAAPPLQPVPAGQPAPASQSAPSVPAISAVPPQGIGEQAPAQAAPLAKAVPPRAPARSLGPSVWVGRYQDSRGSGDLTFTLVRGESTVSGTWKLRTGGGGPITGLLDETGHRMQLRMENIAPECPGTFEGSADISDTSMVATYRGKDCEGAVTQGKLELRPQ
jgi:hypothetical protein